MKHRRLPLGVIAAALLVGLATIGIVNGLWSKNLVINGTVTTGDLNVDWVVASSGDLFGPDGCTDFGGFDCAFLVPKDVGSLDCFIDDEDAQILHFEIFNGYPSYEADCEVHMANTGSIPFVIRGFAIDTSNSSPPLTNCVVVESSDQTQVIKCDQLKVGWFDNVGVQCDPGSQCGASSLLVHVEQAAAQNTCTGTSSFFPISTGPLAPGFVVVSPTCTATPNIYDFQIKVCVAQWNEAATYEQCVLSEQHEGPEFPP